MVEDASSFWADIQRYEDMLAADPASYCFAPLSELYRKLGLLDDAISVAQKGCSTHPDYWGGYLALGAAYYDQGLNIEARQALERVLSLKPDILRARKLLGQLYAGSGEIDLAKELLGQILRQNPGDLESEVLLRSLCSTVAGAELDEEFLEEAEVIEELTDVVDEPPFGEETAPFAAVDFELAGLSLSDEPAKAEPLDQSPPSPARNPLVTATLAELYVSQGFIGKALDVYEELLAADQANQKYRLRAAALMVLAEQQQEAQRPASPSLTGNPPVRQKAAPQLEAELSSWLENIRRRKDGL